MRPSARRQTTGRSTATTPPARDTRRSPTSRARTSSQLKVAWTYHTGDISDGKGQRRRSGFETTPLVVDGTLYLTTGFNRVIALDPASGAERWSYDPRTVLTAAYGDGLINRGVATWLDSTRGTTSPCRRRVFEATLDARIIALDGATGQPCTDFGSGGEVTLNGGVARYTRGAYHMTSPPAVIDDLVVVGSSIDDNGRADMPGGVVRAFDVRTGALRWKWDPIPPNDTGAPGGVWRTGAANAWSILAVDPQRHLVFIPTGSASPDYFGGLRLGDDKWANSVVALRSTTGDLVWGFQLVHHDLWDYDSAPGPLLATLTQRGRPVPVVIQGNKTGFLYVLHRDTGAPVFKVEERPVPKSDVPGEVSSPTQPIPLVLPPLSLQRATVDTVWGLTPQDKAACLAKFAGLRSEGVFTPPSLRGSVVMPGNVGGMNWSGYAFDPVRHLLIVNTNNMAAKVKLIPRDAFDDPKARTEKGEYSPQHGTPFGMFRTFLRSDRGSAVSAAAVGPADGARSQHGQDPLAGAARDVRPRAYERAARGAQPRRADCHRGRPRVHRRHVGSGAARVRPRDGQGSVEGAAAGERPRDADDLQARRREAVRRDCRRRSREDRRRSAERRARRLRAPVAAAVGRDFSPAMRPGLQPRLALDAAPNGG